MWTRPAAARSSASATTRISPSCAGDTSPLTQPPSPAAGWECVDFDAEGLTVQVPDGVLLDFGATAKALAADLAADAISGQMVGVLVNLGGDIAVAGQAPDGGWRIGVDDGVGGRYAGRARPQPPPPPGPPAAAPVVAIEAGGLATSCPSVRGWRRGDRAMHHIVVPSTGQPAAIYWAAVSVAAATCVDANMASTASIIRGRPAQQWLQSLGLPARLAKPDGRVVTTGGWPE